MQARNAADDAVATEPAGVFRVTVSGNNLESYDGTVGLGFATDQDIADESDNALVATLPTNADYETYTLDNTAPTVASIERQAPAGEVTNADTLTFRVTFSEDVDERRDDGLRGRRARRRHGHHGHRQRRAGAQRRGRRRRHGARRRVPGHRERQQPRELQRHGGARLRHAPGHRGRGRQRLAATTPSGVNESYTLDNTAPAVAAIERQAPSDEVTDADTLTFLVTFSEDVENVGTTDFAVAAPGGGTATTATVSGVQARNAADDADATEPAGVFRVTVSGNNLGSYNGTVGLGLATNQNIADAAGNDLTADLPTNADYETYTLDNAAPGFTHLDRHDGQMALDRGTTADELKFRAVFGEPVTGAGTADFAVVEPAGGTATTATVTAVAPYSATNLDDGRGYILTVSGGNLDDYAGDVGIALATGHDIADPAGNKVGNTTATALNEFYSVNSAGPKPSLTASDSGHEGMDSGKIAVTIDFGEGVSGFEPSDVTVTNGTKGHRLQQSLRRHLGGKRRPLRAAGHAEQHQRSHGVRTRRRRHRRRQQPHAGVPDTLTIPYRTPLDAIPDADQPGTQTYTAGVAITPLVLPEGSGGDGGPYSYTLVGFLFGPDDGPLPAGLAFTEGTRTLARHADHARHHGGGLPDQRQRRRRPGAPVHRHGGAAGHHRPDGGLDPAPGARRRAHERRQPDLPGDPSARTSTT